MLRAINISIVECVVFRPDGRMFGLWLLV